MAREFPPLSLTALRHGAQLAQPVQGVLKRLDMEAPAVRIMTDLTLVAAATIEPSRGIEEANDTMIRRGVRLLFVMHTDQRLAGLVTATDILGEKPVRLAVERGIPRRELVVSDIMISEENLEAVDFQTILTSKVGHVVATLKSLGRQHALVVERAAAGDFVRGILSATQIARSLGITLEPGEVSRTFAEIEAALR
ncbi:MAG: CBS domain-containing protein [Betaproteobacteria bacterium]|nr:CBS domain-containing protein [Betaproteobacteria bacterium]